MDKLMQTVRSITAASLNRPVTVLMEPQWKCKQRSPARANKRSVSAHVGVARRNGHVCRCFGTGCLATVTAISHGRNLRPNPIRSGHYWEMSRRGRSGGERERERARRGEERETDEEREEKQGQTEWRGRGRGRGKQKREVADEEGKTTGKWEVWMTSLCQPQCQLAHTHTHTHSQSQSN